MAIERQADTKRISQTRCMRDETGPADIIRSDGKARAQSAGRAIGPPSPVDMTIA